MTLDEIDRLLETPEDRDNSDTYIQLVQTAFAELKRKAVEHGDQVRAKNIWIREQSFKVQLLYLKAYTELKDGLFYDAWCTLERCEITIHFLMRHINSKLARSLKVLFVHQHVKRYQSIFPYKLFMSPEFVKLESECTICGEKISVRNPCGHEKGEIYNGELCLRKITKSALLGTSFVENPIQKYSVPFAIDLKTGNKIDNYKYHFLEYLIPRLKSPWDPWEVRTIEKLYPQDKFSTISRNASCPCGSGKKYKKCCLHKEGIKLPHKEFILSTPPPSGMEQGIVFIGKDIDENRHKLNA